MSALETKLNNLLAEDFGIDPAQVTGTFIRAWRDEHLAHDVSYEVESTYGGYIAEHSHVLTGDELLSMTQAADAFLDRFSH